MDLQLTPSSGTHPRRTRLGLKRRSLDGVFLVPTRRIERARHIPSGRTLHLLDIENLVGGSRHSRDIAVVSAAYRRTAPVRDGDLVIVAAGRTIGIDAWLEWPHAQKLLGRGLNGADCALLAEVHDRLRVPERFDRVVVGSGDGIFASVMSSLRSLGIVTGVVAPRCRLSWKLRRVAHFVRDLDAFDSSKEVA
jgi:hypothetical protein